MNNYENYYLPERLGPIPTPFPECPNPSVEPALGPTPNPKGTQPVPEPVQPHFHKKPAILVPLPHVSPPNHTQIQPRCFTCKHFEMCSYKKDYLKTITLLQSKLGAPAESYEATIRYITIPDFIGFPLIDAEKYLPKKVIFTNEDKEGRFFSARFNGINFVNVVYLVKNNYILLQLKYDKETELYKIKKCQEAFYKIDYELSNDSLEEIQVNLIDWRELIINAVVPPSLPRPEVLNTTHFSAALNCDLYDWNKKTFEEAIKEISHKYPCGIPVDEKGCELYHIATFHIEDKPVPYSPLIVKDNKKLKPPYIPQPKHNKPYSPPKRRDDI